MKHGFLQIHPVAPSCAHLGNWLSTRLHVESTIIDDRTLMPRKTPQSHRKKKNKLANELKYLPVPKSNFTLFVHLNQLAIPPTRIPSPLVWLFKPYENHQHFQQIMFPIFSDFLHDIYIYICIYIDIYIEMLLFNLFGAWTCCFYLFYTPGAVRLTFWGPGSTNPDRVVWRIEVL